MVPFEGCFVVARDFPVQSSSAFIKRSDIRFTVVQPGDHHVVFSQNRRRSVIPIKGVLTKTLHQISLPTNFTVQTDSCKVAAREIDKNPYAVRRRRALSAGTVHIFPPLFPSSS